MTFPIRRVIIDADLLVLSLETLEYSDALERFLRNEGSMFFFIVQDCLERACERHNKDPQEVFSLLSGNVGINIRTSDDVNMEVLGNAINDLESIHINEEDVEKYWDSKVELAYAQAHQIQELLTHRPDYFSFYDSVDHRISIQVIQPRKWLLRLPRLFRQWWSDLGFIKYLILVILGTLIFVGCSALSYKIFLLPSPSFSDSTSICYNCSSGERKLIPTNTRENGHSLFEKKQYKEAYEEFKSDWKETQDPETLIYLNNAFLELQRKQGGRDFNTIAILVPISQKIQTNVNEERDLAKEILRGVAQAQTTHHANIFNKDVFDWNTDNNSNEVNFHFLSTENKPQLEQKGIRVMIIDDENDDEQVEELAKKLVKRDEIQAFVGHYSSELTVKAVNTYNKHQKVLISPGNSTEDLSENNYEYFFKTGPSAEYQAQILLDYINKEINPKNKNTKKVAVCYVNSSTFSKSIYDEFQKLLDQRNTRDIKEINYEKCIGTERNDTFSGSQFNEKEALKEMDEADILVLFPDGQTSKSLENAVNLIKKNEGDKYILGSWTLRNNRTLKTLQEEKKALEDENKALEDEKLVLAVPWEYPFPKNDYAEDVEKLWKRRVSPITALYDDTIQVLISPMNNDNQNLKESLKEYSHKGVTGEISFDRCGNRKLNPMLLVKAVEENNSKLKFEKISGYSEIFDKTPEKCQN